MATYQSSEDMILRVVGGPSNGKTLTITTPKCVIGSFGEDSENPECLIVRGSNGAIAKALTDTIVVNGSPVQSDWLNANDELELREFKFLIESLGKISNLTSDELEAEVPDDLQRQLRQEIDTDYVPADKACENVDLDDLIPQNEQTPEDEMTIETQNHSDPETVQENSQDQSQDQQRLQDLQSQFETLEKQLQERTQQLESLTQRLVDLESDVETQRFSPQEDTSSNLQDQTESLNLASSENAQSVESQMASIFNENDSEATENNNEQPISLVETPQNSSNETPSLAADELAQVFSTPGTTAEASIESSQQAEVMNELETATESDENLVQGETTLSLILNTEEESPQIESVETLDSTNNVAGAPTSEESTDSFDESVSSTQQQLEDLFARIKQNDGDFSNASDLSESEETFENEEFSNQGPVEMAPHFDENHHSESSANNDFTDNDSSLDTQSILERIQNSIANHDQNQEHPPELGTQNLELNTPELQADSGLPSEISSQFAALLKDDADTEQESFVAETPANDPPAKPAPPEGESVADVLARMQAQGQLENNMDFGSDSGSALETESPAPEPATAAVQPTQQPVGEPASSGDGEDSVQDYMSQLFTRLRGEAPAEPVAEKKEEKAEEAQAEDSTPKELVKVLEESEYIPKSVAPEKTMSLAKMRDIANASSRSAIQASDARRKKAQNTMLVGGAFALLSGSFALMMMSEGFGDMISLLACFGFVGGIGMAGFLLKDVIGSTKKTDEDQPNDDPNAEQEAAFVERPEQFQQPVDPSN